MLQSGEMNGGGSGRSIRGAGPGLPGLTDALQRSVREVMMMIERKTSRYYLEGIL